MPYANSDHVIASLAGLDEPTPPILYHYTSMEGLLSIVETGRIRATHIRFLNDSSESETMWTVVLRRLKERSERADSSEEQAYLSEIITATSGRRTHNEYVASFSQEGDDLSQWRAYCPAQPGFSIGFSNAALRSQWVADPHGGKPLFVGGKLAKVRYVNESDTTQIDLAIDYALQFGAMLHGSQGFSGQTLTKGQVAMAWFYITAPIFKNPAFRAESEWRMVLSKPHKPMPGVRFGLGKSSIVPYIEVVLNRDSKFELPNEYMIGKVLIGPTPNPDLSVEAVNSLFAYNGHSEVVVEKSKIPYRHW